MEISIWLLLISTKKDYFFKDEFPLSSCFDVHQCSPGAQDMHGYESNLITVLHPKNVGIMWQDLPLKSMNMTIYLVVDLPLWKMMEFVSGDDYSQLNGTIKKYKNHVPNHQPDILLFQWLTIINRRLTID